MGKNLWKFLQFRSKIHAEMRISLVLIAVVLAPLYVNSAPSKSTRDQSNLPHTVYDLRQTGDYNIQLDLKDFKIIAMLGDDALGGFGEYDYDYDYSDFTVKPSLNSTTTTTEKSDLATKPSTEKPNNEHPYPIVSPSPLPTKISSSKPEEISSSTSETTQKVIVSTTEQSSPPEKITQKILTEIPINSPDKIKVQILQSPVVNPHLEIVPSDDLESTIPEIPLGEVQHYRKCANGYARDKRGRCRRLRRPGTQGFDFSRLASNLAGKFRQSSDEMPQTHLQS